MLPGCLCNSYVLVFGQIARAPPPEFLPDMIAPEKFSKEFTALAKAQGLIIEPGRAAEYSG